MVADGDHVLLARQSSKVPVQHKDQRAAPLGAEPPRAPLVIHEGDVGKEVALADHVIGHARLRRGSSMPRWKVE